MAYTTKQTNYIIQCSNAANIEAAKLLAFLQVETGNQVYAIVYGREEPLIRWEGHYFKKFLKGDKLKRALDQGLAGVYKQVKNPSSQSARYDILARAKKIDSAAAIMSCSWGIGQVMGSHWQALGFKSAEAFEETVRSGFEGQLDVVMLYLDKFNVIPHLRRGDWSAVAKLYNGADYASNAYDVKMKKAYESLTNKPQPKPSSSGMVRAGSKGAGVREVQNLLKLQGYVVNVDGDFGAATQDAVMQFQRDNGLEADGVVGPKTYEKLSADINVNIEQLTKQPIQNIVEVQKGLAAGVTGAVSIEAVKGTLQEALQNVVSIPGLETVSSILSFATAAVVVGGLVYSVWGVIKSKRTRLGTDG